MRDPMFESSSRKEERDWNRSVLVPKVDACESRRNSELALVAVPSLLLSLLRDIEVFIVEKSLTYPNSEGPLPLLFFETLSSLRSIESRFDCGVV
jgi:hypothetical protein